jgi:hypothetical protein
MTDAASSIPPSLCCSLRKMEIRNSIVKSTCSFGDMQMLLSTVGTYRGYRP